MGVLSPLFLILGLTGLSFSVIGAIMMKYPPTNINHWYGYRTSASMRNQQFWDFAQVYSSRVMVLIGLAMCVLGLFGLVLPLPELVGVSLSLAIVIAGAIAIFLLTERALKQRFGSIDE